jgi:hypothetical protein
MCWITCTFGFLNSIAEVIGFAEAIGYLEREKDEKNCERDDYLAVYLF